ncbi:uncharacterized protein B0I36DRAFT_49904 [Microdochium trichocladiopsis]|uniref:Azaphilone pigments biosynthesis cluster protein L N-terminal domain-containing protein n=1 Tax=Microdochium trichocladiopsis TaxID=1682393 RepID=A0A9P8XSK7_9PEZI|nr:uncharacterized protein B0I36DRAFT_49904 [Microdochium trichocladiopsis]KAH7014455.1 hypothetical protein B0I36DRAFT_49904 [Microdochium trichocladiopsis]
MDPLSISASIVAVGGVTLKSALGLLSVIREFRSQNKDARALKSEVNDLAAVLTSLLETITTTPQLDLRALERPLQRCGNACDEYRQLIERCMKHSSENSRSFRDWISQKYLQGDINDFRSMIAAHKSTINIALANANLRIAAVPPEVLEDYKDLISDTTSDLNNRMQDINQKIERLKNGDPAAINDIALEWQAMLEEKESTQQGLQMCAQLSNYILQFEITSKEHPQFSGRLSAHKHMKTGLGEISNSIQSLVSRLQAHEATIRKQVDTMSLDESLSDSIAEQLALLQQTKDSIHQCIEIVSEAGKLVDERSNVFEDITLADNSYAFSVSTVNDLVTARRLVLKGRSRHFGGQVTDDTVVKSIEALTNLDLEHLKSTRDTEKNTPDSASDSRVSPEYLGRYGPGVTVSSRNAG